MAFKTNGRPSKVYHWKNGLDSRNNKFMPKYSTTEPPLTEISEKLNTIRRSHIEVLPIHKQKPPKTSPMPEILDNEINTNTYIKDTPDNLQKKYQKYSKKESQIFRIKPYNQPKARQRSSQKKYYNGKPTGLYLWESKSKNSYKPPIFFKLKQK